MSTSPVADPRPFVLVVGVDLTDTESSGYALDQATRMAVRMAGAEMHLVHVLREGASGEAVGEAAGCFQRYLSAKAGELDGLRRVSIVIHVRAGHAGREIAQLANDVNADLVVVGTHRRPYLRHLVVGSTAEQVMATAHCPVFVTGPRPLPSPSHVIVIDPPCPDCVQTRQASQGRSWWCARHSERHGVLHHSHRYSYQNELPFETHDSEVSPTGV